MAEKSGFWGFYESGRADAFGWALIFFWGALTVLAEITGFSSRFAWWDGWSVFFTGFGVIVLLGVPPYLYVGKKSKAGWNLIIGIILLAVGLSDLVNFGWIWVVILLVIGLAILQGAFKKKK
ncbi:hypothetical protein KY339_03495 [Candidatus Woesearchaeota archaeon]|nr:hypothetical protein [Candidatus Woesearchaeota archaeon]